MMTSEVMPGKLVCVCWMITACKVANAGLQSEIINAMPAPKSKGYSRTAFAGGCFHEGLPWCHVHPKP